MVDGLPKVSDTDHRRIMLMSRLPESWKGAFDRVVSIEMLEAVGYVGLFPNCSTRVSQADLAARTLFRVISA